MQMSNRVWERLQHFAAQPSSHSWHSSPAENILIGDQCGLYIVDAPHGKTADRSFASKERGSGLSGCGKASVITMTEMCGCRSHPLMVGLRFFEPCIRVVNFDDCHGCVHMPRQPLPREDRVVPSRTYPVSDVQIIRHIPLGSWFLPEFPKDS